MFAIQYKKEGAHLDSIWSCDWGRLRLGETPGQVVWSSHVLLVLYVDQFSCFQVFEFMCELSVSFS
jgi:hypothetical protein